MSEEKARDFQSDEKGAQGDAQVCVPLYVILSSPNPDELSLAASELIRDGYTPHGDLKLQTIADESSLTFARLIYIQAMWRQA